MRKLSMIVVFLCFFSPIFSTAGSVDVSGYTDKGIYVWGELDVGSGGSVDGHLYTNSGSSIYVNGDLESGGEVYIYNDNWGGGGYHLDVD